jgi:hypothetical protein
MFRVYMDVWIFVVIFVGAFAAGYVVGRKR